MKPLLRAFLHPIGCLALVLAIVAGSILLACLVGKGWLPPPPSRPRRERPQP